MPRYQVPVTAVASVRRVFTVDAENAEQAADIAQMEADKCHTNDYLWDLNGLLDCDGHCDLEAFCAKEVMIDEIEEDVE